MVDAIGMIWFLLWVKEPMQKTRHEEAGNDQKQEEETKLVS